jgi:hypothetical protein
MAYFPNTPPKAQSATVTARQQYLAHFEKFIKANFGASPVAVVLPCAFGGDPDEQAIGDDIINSAPVSTTDSEALGEMGAIYYLQSELGLQSVVYDDNALNIFAGAHAFNMVYFDAPPPNATRAIIIEAKGGNSQCGSRKDPLTGAKVTQGSDAYADVIIRSMSASKAPDRRKVGMELAKLQGKNPPQIAYIGVRTKYDMQKQEVYDPVPIFYQEL